MSASSYPIFTKSSLASNHELEASPLVGHVIKYSSESILRNFYVYSIVFGIFHAIFNTLIAFAVIFLPQIQFILSIGVSSIAFTISCLFLTKPILGRFGSHQSFQYAIHGYILCLFLLFCLIFLQKYFYSMLSTALVVLVFTLSGLSSAILWCSQGRYYALHTKLYAESTGFEVESIHVDFISSFAIVVFGLEALIRFVAFFSYTYLGTLGIVLVGIVSVVLIVFSYLSYNTLDDLDDLGNKNATYNHISMELGATLRLVTFDYRLIFYLPYQAVVGFAIYFYTIFLVQVSTGQVSSTYDIVLSSNVIAYIALLTSVLAFVTSKLVKWTGKFVLFGVSSSCLIISTSLFFVYSFQSYQTSWQVFLVSVTLFGIAKSTWVSCVTYENVGSLLDVQSHHMSCLHTQSV